MAKNRKFTKTPKGKTMDSQSESTGTRGRGRPKQTRLPDLPGGEKHPDISEAAEAYVQCRDVRMEATKDEVATRDTLVLAMRTHSVSVYRDPDSDLVVTLIEGAVKVKVRHESEEEETEEEEVPA